MKQLKQLIIPPEGVKRYNPPFGKPLDEVYKLLDGEYFSRSDEYEELENSAAEEDKNHLDVAKNNNKHPVDVHTNNGIEKSTFKSTFPQFI